MFAEFVLAARTAPVFAVRPIVRTRVSAAGTTAPRIKNVAAGAAALMALKAKLFSYDVGTPYVPYDQMAVVHQGEMILPKTFADGVRNGDVALGGGGSTIVQVFLDGRMITEQVSDRMYQNTRRISKGNYGVTNAFSH